MQKVELSFVGPFGWLKQGPLPSILTHDDGKEPGIYLWTAGTPEGELVWYVGETARSFKVRMREHLIEQLGGRYRILEPNLFNSGQKMCLWHGGFGDNTSNWPDLFLDKFPDLAGPLTEFVSSIRFMVAPLESETRLRRRVEAAIADHLYAQPDPIGSFQELINYERTVAGEEPLQVSFVSQVPIRGLPTSLQV